MGASISETTIRQHTTATAWSRGEDYYQGGAVTDMVQRGDTLSAQVEGSDVKPYRIDIQVDAGDIQSAHCTCPYIYEGWCKHIVAEAFALAKVLREGGHLTEALAIAQAGLPLPGNCCYRVIKTARQQAEPIMVQGKSARYQEAVKWLQQAKTAYGQAGQQSAWASYFNQLQGEHARKRKLMDLFKQLR